MASGFANQAALAIELAEARAEQQRAVMFEERDRIAADLHDHVIQRLFAAGLSLQSVAARLPQGRDADRIVGAITDLDDTISQIRNTIFQLQQVPQQRGPPSGGDSSTCWRTSPRLWACSPPCGWPDPWSTCSRVRFSTIFSPCCGRRSPMSPGTRTRPR